RWPRDWSSDVCSSDLGQVDLLLTTGGTGIGPRDNTPEATQAVADRIVPGISEEMRRKGLEHTPTAVLSRSTAAVRSKTLIVNLRSEERRVGKEGRRGW